MTIVDRQHAAQLVTGKGKCFKFDAIECMIHYLDENSTSIAYYLAADFQNPGELIDAKKASFIISEKIPSPMKANLSALASEGEANILLKDKGGQLYSWAELQTQLKKKNNVQH
jgi:copper chaperone NosL